MSRPLIRIQKTEQNDPDYDDTVTYYNVSKRLARYLSSDGNKSSREVIKHASVDIIYATPKNLGPLFYFDEIVVGYRDKRYYETVNTKNPYCVLAERLPQNYLL